MPTNETSLLQKEKGKVPEGEGWFIVNAQESTWFEHDRFGTITVFEGKARFSQLGINIHIIKPGQPSSLYHRESEQEDFLVLSGSCKVIVNEEERPLKTWDFFHCPPGTDHVFIGGEEPCAVLMVGTRRKESEITYPVSTLGAKYEASVSQETTDAKVAYENTGRWNAVSFSETILKARVSEQKKHPVYATFSGDGLGRGASCVMQERGREKKSRE